MPAIALALALAAVCAPTAGGAGGPPRPPRIVALAPHLAEIAFAAGAGGQLAAVVRYSDHPPAAAALPTVGDASRIDIESVLALRPDLILAWKSGNPALDVRRLRSLGFRVHVSEPRALADIPALVRTVGALAGTSGPAEAAARQIEQELESLRVRYGARSTVRVFYEIWHRPLLTVNGAHMISHLIALCGGQNVFGDARPLTPSVSYEAVLARRPDVILGGSSAGTREDLSAAWARAPGRLLRTTAVRYIDPDLVQRQSPRIVQGARAICEALDGIRGATSPASPR